MNGGDTMIKIECTKCGAVREVPLSSILRSILVSVDRDAIYAGFLCERCGEAEESQFANDEE